MKNIKISISLLIILSVIVPFITNILFKIPAPWNFLEAEFEIADIFNYLALIISNIFLCYTVYITIRNSNKEKKMDLENEKLVKLLNCFSADIILKLYNEKSRSKKTNQIIQLVDEIFEAEYSIKLYLTKKQLKLYEASITPITNKYRHELSELTQIYAHDVYTKELERKTIKEINVLENKLKDELFINLKTLFDSF